MKIFERVLLILLITCMPFLIIGILYMNYFNITFDNVSLFERLGFLPIQWRLDPQHYYFGTRSLYNFVYSLNNSFDQLMRAMNSYMDFQDYLFTGGFFKLLPKIVTLINEPFSLINFNDFIIQYIMCQFHVLIALIYFIIFVAQVLMSFFELIKSLFMLITGQFNIPYDTFHNLIVSVTPLLARLGV